MVRVKDVSVALTNTTLPLILRSIDLPTVSRPVAFLPPLRRRISESRCTLNSYVLVSYGYDPPADVTEPHFLFQAFVLSTSAAPGASIKHTRWRQRRHCAGPPL